MYHKFQIGEADQFDASHFPDLPTNLANIVQQLHMEPKGPAAAMLLSFVKEHAIRSQLVMDHPRLATLISTKELPLGLMEDLFEASRKNPAFRQALEAYIRSGLHQAGFNE